MSKVRGLTINIGADTSTFNKEIKKVNNEINNTNKEVKTLAKSLELQFDAKKFAKAQQEAQRAIELTDTKADALRNRLKSLEQSGQVNTKEYADLQRQLSETEYKALQLRRTLEELKALRIEELAKKFETVGSSITKVGQAMAPVSAAAAALLAGFAKIGLSAVKFGDEVGTTAQRLNISAESLQRWYYIADQTDVAHGDLVQGITKIQVALSQLAQGELTSTSKRLMELGLTQEQALGGMEANFENIIGALANMEDATMQAFYANELFGNKMANKLIPLLNDGGVGLSALAEEFESLGYLTNDQISTLDSFEDVMDRVKYQLGLVKNQIGLALLPVMQALATFVETKVVPVLQRFKDFMASLSEEQLINATKTLVLVAALAPLLLIIGKLVSGIGGMIRMVGGLSKALTMLSAHPIIAVIGIVVLLLMTLYSTNEEFRKSINNLFKTLSSSLMPIINTLMKALGSIFNAIMPLINLIAKILIPIINILAKAIEFQFGIMAKVVEKYIKFIENVINFAIDLINGFIRSLNVMGKVLGFTLKELDKISLTGEITVNEPEIIREEEEVDPQDIIARSMFAAFPQTVINNDYSDKDITVEIVVQNFAEEIDVDDLVRQINIKLAEAF